MSSKPEKDSKLDFLYLQGYDSNGAFDLRYKNFCSLPNCAVIGDCKKGFSKSEISKLMDRVDEHTKIFIGMHGNNHENEHYVLINENDEIPTSDIFIALSTLSRTPKQIYVFSCYSGNVIKFIDYLPPDSLILSFSDHDSVTRNVFSDELLTTLKDNPKAPMADFMIKYFGQLGYQGAHMGIKQEVVNTGAGVRTDGGSTISRTVDFDASFNIGDLLSSDIPTEVLVSSKLEKIISFLPDHIAPYKYSAPEIEGVLLTPTIPKSDHKPDTEDLASSGATTEASSTILSKNLDYMMKKAVTHYVDRAIEYYPKDDPQVNIIDLPPKAIKRIDEASSIIWECSKLYLYHSAQELTVAKTPVIPQMLKCAIEKGADPYALNAKGETILTHYHKSPNTLNMLLDLGIDINMQNIKGETLLHLAAKTGDFRIIKLALEKGADPNLLDKNGDSALKLVLDNTKMLSKESLSGITSKTKILDLLLSYGADPTVGNQFSPSNYDAMMSCFKPLPETTIDEMIGMPGDRTFRWYPGLVQYHFKDAPDKVINEKKLLHYATNGSDDRLIKFLLERGANVNELDDFGKTPLMLLAEKSTNQDTLSILLNRDGVDLHIRDKSIYRYNALDYARLGGWGKNADKIFSLYSDEKKLEYIRHSISEKSLTQKAIKDIQHIIEKFPDFIERQGEAIIGIYNSLGHVRSDGTDKYDIVRRMQEKQRFIIEQKKSESKVGAVREPISWHRKVGSSSGVTETKSR